MKMKILLKNSGWLQYHLMDAFLNDGIHVDHLVKEGEEAEHDLFFGRNSFYEKCSNIAGKEYDAAIYVGETEMDAILARRVLLINPDGIVPSHSIPKKLKKTVIIAPMVFGEWMPMYEDGIIYKDTKVPFDSGEFRNGAIYAEDFARAVLQWLMIPRLPDVMEAFPFRDKSGTSRLANSVAIRENNTIEENIMKMKKHFSFIKSISK